MRYSIELCCKENVRRNDRYLIELRAVRSLIELRAVRSLLGKCEVFDRVGSCKENVRRNDEVFD